MFLASKWSKIHLQVINTGSTVCLPLKPDISQRVHTHTHPHPHQVSHTKVNSQTGPRCSNANWQSVRQSANTQGGGLHIWTVSQTTTQRNAHSKQRINSSSPVIRIPTTFHSRSRSNSKTITLTLLSPSECNPLCLSVNTKLTLKRQITAESCLSLSAH